MVNRQTANDKRWTWPSFPFTCRLLPIISTNKLIVSRNFFSIRIVLSFLYLLIFYFVKFSSWMWRLPFAVCRIRESAIFNSATKTAELTQPRPKAFRLPCLSSGGELRYWRHFIYPVPKHVGNIVKVLGWTILWYWNSTSTKPQTDYSKTVAGEGNVVLETTLKLVRRDLPISAQLRSMLFQRVIATKAHKGNDWRGQISPNS